MNTKKLERLDELNSELACAADNLFVLITALDEDRFTLEVIVNAIRAAYDRIADINSAMQDEIQLVITQEVEI